MIGYYGHAGGHIGRVVGHLWDRHLSFWHYSTGLDIQLTGFGLFSMVVSHDDGAGSGISLSQHPEGPWMCLGG